MAILIENVESGVKKGRILVIITVLSIVTLSSFYSVNFSILFSYMAYPYIKLYSIGRDIGKSFQQFFFRTELFNHLVELKKENAQLRSEVISLRSYISIGQQTKHLGEVSLNTVTVIAAAVRILSIHMSEYEHFLLLDIGSLEGVTTDMVVTYAQNVVGKIDTVYPWYSKVSLITDKKLSVGVYCADTHVYGLFQGQNKSIANILHIPHTDTLKKDDLVLTSGQSMIFPEGLAIGTVIDFELQNLEYLVSVRPCIDIPSLKFCSVITKKM